MNSNLFVSSKPKKIFASVLSQCWGKRGNWIRFRLNPPPNIFEIREFLPDFPPNIKFRSGTKYFNLSRCLAHRRTMLASKNTRNLRSNTEKRFRTIFALSSLNINSGMHVWDFSFFQMSLYSISCENQWNRNINIKCTKPYWNPQFSLIFRFIRL